MVTFIWVLAERDRRISCLPVLEILQIKHQAGFGESVQSKQLHCLSQSNQFHAFINNPIQLGTGGTNASFPDFVST